MASKDNLLISADEGEDGCGDVYAHLVQAGGGGPDAPEKQHRHVQAQAVSYETGRDQGRGRA